jgi:WD40 repeat protein
MGAVNLMPTYPSLVAWSLLLPGIALAAAPPPAPRSTPPLPRGAIARFGDPTALFGDTERLLLSHDGRILIRRSLVYGDDRVYDLRTGRPTTLPLPKGCDFRDVEAFAPNGDMLVVEEGRVRLITRRGQVRLSRPLRANAWPTVLLSEDGQTLVCRYTHPFAIHAYDLSPGGKALPVELGEESSSLVALSSDGKQLAVFQRSSPCFQVWDTRSGKKLQSIKISAVAGQEVSTAVFSPDGGTLAVELDIGGLQLWRVGTGSPLRSTPRTGRKLLHLRFNPDGHTLTALAITGELLRLDSRTGKITTLGKIPLTGDDNPAFAISGDGSTVALMPKGQPLVAWDLARRQRLLHVPFNLDLDRLTGHSPTRIRMIRGDRVVEWDVRTGAVTEERPRPTEEWRLDSLLNSRLQVHGQYEHDRKQVVVRHLPSGKELHRVGPVRKRESTEVVLASRGQNLVAVGNGGPLRLFQAGRADPILEYGERNVAALGFSSDGRLLVFVPSLVLARNEDGVVWPSFRELVFIELASRKERSRVPLRQYGDVQNLLFDPAGRYVVAVSEGDVFVVDQARATVRCRLDGSKWSCLSPDGRWLALGDCLHDLRNSGTPRSVWLDVGEDGVRGLAFTSDGKYLVSACDNGTALVWDLARLTPRATRPAVPTTDQLWTRLTSADAEQAGSALRRLAASPATTVRLIRDRLRPARGVSDEAITRLVADLDSPQFATRNSAERELARLAEQAGPALRAAARQPRSAEQRRRLLRLLERLDNPESTPGQLRALRAVEVLETIGTPDARQVLATLAGGATRARLSVEAKAALERLRLADRSLEEP